MQRTFEAAIADQEMKELIKDTLKLWSIKKKTEQQHRQTITTIKTNGTNNK